jgi:hypothetical protein
MNTSVLTASLAALGLMVGAAPALAGAGSNTASAKACQKDGYKNYTTSGGQRFANSDQCTAYAAGKGNTLTFDLLEVTPQPLFVGDRLPGALGIGTVTVTNVGSVATGSLNPDFSRADPPINFNVGGASSGRGCLPLAPGQSCTLDLGLAPAAIGPAQVRVELAYSASGGRTGLEYIYVTATGILPPPTRPGEALCAQFEGIYVADADSLGRVTRWQCFVAEPTPEITQALRDDCELNAPVGARGAFAMSGTQFHDCFITYSA